MIIQINPDNPQERLIRKVAEILKEGGIIAYPTDTYYGIGCDIMNKKAIETIYRIKNRNKNKPFSFICSDLKHISDYAKVTNASYRTLKRLLPGPYTFILEGSKLVPKIMLTKRRTAGIRVPDHKVALALVESLGNPIISTTATAGDRTILSDPSFIEEAFKSDITVVVDSGPVNGSPSSVISLIEDAPEIIREGLGDVTIFK